MVSTEAAKPYQITQSDVTYPESAAYLQSPVVFQ